MKNIFLTTLLSFNLLAFSIAGVGTNTCENYLEQKHKPMLNEMYVQFALGYLAADEADIKDAAIPSMIEHLNNFCSTNKKDLYINAVADLAQTLKL